MPSIIFDGWREEGKRYWYGGAYIYKYEVSVKWTVYNDLNTAIFLLPRITGFGVDTGYLQGHVINPNQTYNGECGYEFDWIEGAESDVTVEYVYSLDSFKPPYYNLGSASKHVIMPNYPPPTPTHNVTVQSTPIDGVSVSLDGAPVGVTPLTVTVGEGTHQFSVPLEVVKYRFVRWDDGSINPTRTVNVTGDMTLTAYYEAVPEYSNVTITVVGQGTTDPPAGNYPSTYPVGSTLYVTAYPAEGWVYDHMNRNGVPWTSANPGEFSNLTATENIEVIFTAPTPVIPPVIPTIQRKVRPRRVVMRLDLSETSVTLGGSVRFWGNLGVIGVLRTIPLPFQKVRLIVDSTATLTLTTDITGAFEGEWTPSKTGSFDIYAEALTRLLGFKIAESNHVAVTVSA
jgi:hypothetical protein